MLRSLLTSLALISTFGTQPMLRAEDVTSKSIQEYPTSRKIWLSLEDGLIQPANLKQYRSLSEGYITFLKPNGAELQEGETWAIIDKDQLDLESRALELEKKKVSKALDDLQEEQQAFIDKQLLNLEALKLQRIELKASLENSSLPDKLKDKIREALTKLDEQEARLQKSIKPENLESELQLKSEELTLSLDRKIRAHEKLEKRSHLKADFQGTLTISLDETQDPNFVNKPQWVEINKLYASITNDSHYEIEVTNRNPAFNSHDRSKLIAMVDDGVSRQLIRAKYKELRTKDTGGAIRDFHIFTIPEKHSEFAAKNSGETRTIFLYLTLEEDCYVIKKNQIALTAPKVLQTEGWPGLIKHLYPGYKLLHIGPKTLAVIKDDGNKH
ncbi:hypothetical protein [Rubritalea squalenifaciens]|nr:hypothetical protein [Rubritalea squalenifaciens]